MPAIGVRSRLSVARSRGASARIASRRCSLASGGRQPSTTLPAGAPPPTGPEVEQQLETFVASSDVDAFWLDGALTRLSERERTVIELAYFGDLSESAIATRLRVPLGSVKSWKRRGLNRLASLLGEESR